MHLLELTGVNSAPPISAMNRCRATDSKYALDASVQRRSNGPMTNKQVSETVLHRIDPAQNMARFYCLALQPTLFGEVSVVRAWGRIGTRGRMKIDSYATGEGASAALARLEGQKRRRGYRG
jgi:predicted DNA-binding WGR domain protein